MIDIFLPTPSDWDRWLAWSEKLGVEWHDADGWEILDPEIQRLLMIAVRKVGQEFPITMEELQEDLEEDATFIVSGGGFFYEWKRSTLTKFLRDLSGSFSSEFGYLNDFLLSQWRERFGEGSKRLRKLNGNKTVYALTAKGALAYEASLLIPCLSLSLSPLRIEWSRVTIPDFSLRWGILNRPGFEPIRLSSDFLEKFGAPSGKKYYERELKKAESILGADLTFFRRMVNPMSLAAREYNMLHELQHQLEGFQRLVNEEDKANAKKDAYEKETPSNILISIDFSIQQIELQKRFFESFFAKHKISRDKVLLSRSKRDSMLGFAKLRPRLR
jgi:hypothetical protein